MLTLPEHFYYVHVTEYSSLAMNVSDIYIRTKNLSKMYCFVYSYCFKLDRYCIWSYEVMKFRVMKSFFSVVLWKSVSNLPIKIFIGLINGFTLFV